MSKTIKAVFVTNIPVPYRETIHDLVAKNQEGIDYSVIYCAHIEPNRLWKIQFGDYKRHFLKQRSFQFQGNRIYFGLDIISKLNDIKPDVVILGSLSITALFAVLWASLNNAKRIFFSDSHIEDEKHLSFVHKTLRKIFYKKNGVFIGPSQKTEKLFSHYAKNINFFQSALCANNAYYKPFAKPINERHYDIIYSGQICDRKMPFFFAEVIRKVQEQRPVRVAILGDGIDRDSFLSALKKTGAEIDYKGFVDQESLPKLYANAKLLLFPTKRDAWGVVANEALACGTPVITSAAAGVANELVIPNLNGYVLENNSSLWASYALNILTDISLWNRLSEQAFQSVSSYTYENAANGIVKAIQCAVRL